MPLYRRPTRTFTVNIGDGTNVPAVNSYGKFPAAPSSGTIVKWSVTGDQSGSATIDVLKASASASPSYTSMVGAGTKPNISTAEASVGNAPASWTTTTFSKGDMFKFNLDSVTTCRSVTLVLEWVGN